MFARVTSIEIQKVSSRKKWPNDTQDKNAIENLGVLTSNTAIITFRECI